MNNNILIIGACGQIGTELTSKLRELYGTDSVIASDIHEGSKVFMQSGPFEILNALDYNAVLKIVQKHSISSIYLMAAMLSATAEKIPEKAWNLNINSLFNVLNLAKKGNIKKIFWPSSIAVFGPTTPKENTPQHTIMEPTTVYGISKQAGERWCEYYFTKYGVDVRSLRYPGIISWKTNPGGGTTDYAIEIFHKAILEETYTSFLNKNTMLPMMYIDDAIDATIEIMNSNSENIKIRSSYNITSMSFTPEDLYLEIKKSIPEFKINYKPDFRQTIAESWPKSIDDTEARIHWGWKPNTEIEKMSKIMLKNLKNKYRTH